MHTRQSSGKAILAAVACDRSRRTVVSALVLFGLALSFPLWNVRAAEAQHTFTVTNADDGGSGSLRIAIGLANLTGGGDIINFDPTFFSVPRTINLEGSLTPIVDDLRINGPGANLLTIAGDHQSRVINVSSGVTVNLNGLTITGGNAGAAAGGGIFNGGDLSINDCYITGNTAAFGGGINNDFSTSLLLLHSTISNNTATGSATGGGISSEASVTIINSTISENTVTGSGGGSGGGLRLESATIENSTIANNSAAGPNSAGGLRENVETVTLRSTIIAANVNNGSVPDVSTTSGSFFSGGFNLIGNRGSVAFNGPHDQSGTAAAPLDPMLTTLADFGGPTPVHALRGGSPALDQGVTLSDVIDQRGVPRPFDVTSIPGPGDQSDIGAVEMQAIIVTNASDAGAGSLRQAMIDATADSKLDDILFDSALFGTPQIIRLASPLPSILTELNIIGPGAQRLTVRRDTGGPYRIFTVFHARASLSGMTIANGEADFGGGADVIEGSLAITDCALTGNHALSSSGGGVRVSTGVLTVTGSTISSNFADQSGGGLYDKGGVARVVNSTISGNRAVSGGGAIYNFSFNSSGSTLDVVNSTIANNLAGTGSGGILSTTRAGASSASTALRNTIIANTDLPNFDVQDESPAQSSVLSRGFNLASDSGEGVLDQPTDQLNKDPKLGPLQYNGDGTPTHMLLVGSPALDKGNSQGIALDQRGLPRSFDIASLAPAGGGDNSDIGAVEVQAHIVTNANDHDSGSLRQVIAEAPAHSDILFDESFSEGVISLGLTGGEILIDKPLTINGPGTTLLTLSGLNANRIFRAGGGGLHVVISDLTIANGKAADVGGGIVSDSNLTLNRCAIVNNAAGGTFAGGGVYLGGSVGTFTDCTWSGNMSVGDGGGIVVASGNVTFTGCTLNGNMSGFRGGAIDLFDSNGSFTNCTISGNSATAGGGISVFGDTGNPLLAVASSTITENNIGGIRLDGPVTLTVGNSIVANNSDMSLTAVNGAIMTSLGYNLLGNLGVNLAMNDRIINDVKLAPLSDNGGPTQTRALLPGSPAIDQGSSFGLSTDQRSFPRPLDDPSIRNADGGDGADIGAFELGLPLPACVGDCNNSNTVTVDELLSMVNIALGNADVSTCLAGDADHINGITIDEILTAVNNALNGCQ